MSGFSWTLDPRIELARGGIDAEQAERQERTAGAILDRLEGQPGLVLADEVGMGKTFVALAVAVSLAWRSEQPVVVMASPRLTNKWRGDARRFASTCVVGTDGASKPEVRIRVAESGAEFLKCFDDAPGRQAHLVLLASTALHRAERDPWVRLAAIKRALKYVGADDGLRRVVPRYAADLLRSSAVSGLDEADFEYLLSSRIDSWRKYLQSIGKDLGDDPVPRPFLRALHGRHLGLIGGALDAVPRRKSAALKVRLAAARKAVTDALHDVWSDVLKRAKVHSPLLIFDEAHHLKNPGTRVASLFQDPEASDTSVITGAFDRMLFLTATPFQLGHGELLEVLSRFRAVRWEAMPNGATPEAFKGRLDGLREALDTAQRRALSLDRLWGKLRADDLGLVPGEELPAENWQELLREPPPSGPVYDVLAEYEKARDALREAESRLRPWVIRHLRARSLKTDNGEKPRRLNVTGRGIRDGIPHHAGLEVDGDARFPFLLCARAQGLLARRTGRRAYFAEGLASSFGAFRDTSPGRLTDDPDTTVAGGEDDSAVQWYVRAVDELIGEERSAADHPKVAATVDRAVAHWLDGHKILVFGHFRMTIRDVYKTLDARINQEIARLAARALKLDRGAGEEALSRIERIRDRLVDRESPLHTAVQDVLARWVEEEVSLTLGERERVVALLHSCLAARSFLVRSFPLDREEVRTSLEADRPTGPQARAAAQAVGQSLARRRGSGLPSFQERVKAFVRHVVDDIIDPEERTALFTDLHDARLGVVEVAHGDVKEETRRRRLRGFNSPLLPEILVASEVMAEGLDLHIDCRHVIHHDLSWNPSTLEQRTGRVDRLRCRAEADGESIHVYLPYLEGTADEKMFRVVSDRARWFQVVMGERYQVDEAATESLAERVPFPEAAARGLMFDLSVSKASTLAAEPSTIRATP